MFARACLVACLVATLAAAALAPAARACGRVALVGDDEAAIRGVIAEQIAAFKRDDSSAAFALAAPRIKTIFRTPERFMAMVRDSYLPVYRPSHFAFREIAWIDGLLVQPVLVIGPSGVPMTALYLMERQFDGTWQIGGVVLVPEPDSGS
jgi:hypothetical protein